MEVGCSAVLASRWLVASFSTTQTVAFYPAGYAHLSKSRATPPAQSSMMYGQYRRSLVAYAAEPLLSLSRHWQTLRLHASIEDVYLFYG
jgi:CHAT domain-containing protein